MGIYKTGIWKTNNIYEKTLPDGYTELEYIEADSTQYIDTDFKPNQDTRIIVDFDIPTHQNWMSPLGTCGGERNTYKFFLMELNNANSYNCYYGADPVSSIGLNNTTGRHYIDWNKNVFLYDNVQYALPVKTFQSEYNMHIFGATWYDGEHHNLTNIMKLYSFKLYDNGTLIRNYIPAKRAVDNALGLYDTVNNEFYENAGTGTFIAGSAISGASDKAKIYENKLEANSFIEI